MANRSIAPSTESVDRQRRARFTPKTILLALLPLVLLGGVLALIVATDAGLGERAVPPIEELNVQRVLLPEPGMIKLEVVNAGPDPITIAQVMVDEAYWQYEIAPAPTLERRASATLSIPYPWVQDEAHGIALLSETGVLFETEIPVAIQSPVADRASFAQFALVGLYVGIVPVSLGLLWYPTMRRLGRRGMNFVLALTVGLLVFLAVDMWGEAQEIALGPQGSSTPQSWCRSWRC